MFKTHYEDITYKLSCMYTCATISLGHKYTHTHTHTHTHAHAYTYNGLIFCQNESKNTQISTFMLHAFFLCVELLTMIAYTHILLL